MFLGLSFDWLLDPTYQQWLLRGLGVTLELAAVSSVFAVLLGFLLALVLSMRIWWIDAFIEPFIELFRNTPPLLQMLFFYFVLGKLGFQYIDPATGLSTPMFSASACATISLSLFGGALCTEAFRGGMDAVPKATLEAAESLGYSRWALFLNIQIPIVTRITLPSLANILTNLFKTTSQASVIAVPELMYYAGQIYNDTFLTLEVMLSVLIVYVVLVSTLAWLITLLEKALTIPGYGRGD